MKVSKDFKIGIIALIAIILVLLLLNYIIKADLFDRDNSVYAVFSSASGVQVNDRVLVKGLPVGSVFKMEPADKNMSAVKVTLKLNNDINIPVNSVASISSGGPLSPAVIVIEKGNSNTFLDHGDVIQTKVDDMASNIKAQVQPIQQKINTITDSLSTVLNQYNTKLDDKKQADLRNRIAALNRQMASYYSLSQQMNQSTTATLNNLAQTTGDYSNRSSEVNEKINNANAKTNQLAQLNLRRKVDSVNRQISDIRSRLAGITEGKLGPMVKNRDMYNSLNEQLLQTEIMLDDIRVNPKRYVDISVLGKSSKAPELTESEAAKQRTQQNIEFNRKQQEEYKNH